MSGKDISVIPPGGGKSLPYEMGLGIGMFRRDWPLKGGLSPPPFHLVAFQEPLDGY